MKRQLNSLDSGEDASFFGNSGGRSGFPELIVKAALAASSGKALERGRQPLLFARRWRRREKGPVEYDRCGDRPSGARRETNMIGGALLAMAFIMAA